MCRGRPRTTGRRTCPDARLTSLGAAVERCSPIRSVQAIDDLIIRPAGRGQEGTLLAAAFRLLSHSA
ncbi:hypothetical protein EYF80_004029 [Liparis tanakae]|uniref:Uncharacterized protein n=1 Tax=Liparis tanakae TaxID=230148 RepID=A0A4Z2J8K2_9TELE|nr:hypothetical protein EYF80_004029 [Liparis tanakae]